MGGDDCTSDDLPARLLAFIIEKKLTTVHVVKFRSVGSRLKVSDPLSSRVYAYFAEMKQNALIRPFKNSGVLAEP